MNRATPTVQFASVVYGDGVELDDAAETYHEAAKLHPSTAAHQMRGVRVVEEHVELSTSIARAGRRHRHRPRTALPPAHVPGLPLVEALARRRSTEPAPGSSTTAASIGSLLAAAGASVRYAPSGGALYPLELYLLAGRVEGVLSGVYHYDSIDHCLELLPRAAGRIADMLVVPELAERAAALVAVTGVFWRSRFKYGQRGYRFTLLEAGHAVQNLLLVAAGLGLAALPLGGFFDGPVDHLLGVDGVDESVVYLVAVGERSDA